MPSATVARLALSGRFVTVTVSGTRYVRPDLEMAPTEIVAVRTVAVTVTDARPVMVPCVASTVPVAEVAGAVKTVEVPCDGENRPPAMVDDHAGSRPAVTGFVYASKPEARNVWVPPPASDEVAGDTAMRASAPGPTVSTWAAVVHPDADAARVG